MKQNPLRKITRELAGHIRQPMCAREIATKLESGEYSAELLMQHLLLLVDRIQEPESARFEINEKELAENQFMK